MPEQDELNKKLSIKVNVVKRCTKEIGYYEMEVEKQTNLIHELEQKGGCAHEIKKQYEILEETKRMIPDCKSTLGRAVADLREYISSGAEFEAELFSEARTLI